jgi:hypothetical protein
MRAMANTSGTVERLVQETDLAWALAEAVKPHLSVMEHNAVFVAIGAGETFAAICRLFKFVATKRIPLRAQLVQRCITWLHAYIGHEDERYLRRLIEDYLTPPASRVPIAKRIPGPGQAREGDCERASYLAAAQAITSRRLAAPHRFGTARDARTGHHARKWLSVRILFITSNAATL